MMDANPASSRVSTAYESGWAGDINAPPGRCDAAISTAAAEEPRGSVQARGADAGDVSHFSLERLHLAVSEIFDAVSSALQEEWDTAHECVQRASAILETTSLFPHSYGSISANQNRPPIRGGLAPWQIRRVTTYIENHLDTTIRTKDLAAVVRLSAFHFCRAFRT